MFAQGCNPEVILSAANSEIPKQEVNKQVKAINR